MTTSGLAGVDDHHSIVPAVTLLYDAFGPLRLGGEVSGVRGVFVRGERDFGWAVESVDGVVYSALVVLGRQPTEGGRLTYSLGAGLDHYRVAVNSWLDQRDGLDLPAFESQPERSGEADADPWGGHVRMGLDLYLTDAVSVGLNALRRWNDPVSVPGVRLIDAQGGRWDRLVAALRVDR